MADAVSTALRKGCELRFGRFPFRRRCGLPSVGVCQYCAREFCADHGSKYRDRQEVCHREICQRKVADLAIHLKYREAAQIRNAWQRCGVEGCEGEIWGQCSGCRALYCFEHVHNRVQSVWHGGIRVERPASLCDHCWARRHIWNRR